jgi:hypothetical protein
MPPATSIDAPVMYVTASRAVGHKDIGVTTPVSTTSAA